MVTHDAATTAVKERLHKYTRFGVPAVMRKMFSHDES
jgi:hypothetical protein